MAGFFVTFEGIDKSGKSTLAEQTVERLQAEGQQVVSTWEPGGTALGKQIRKLVLGSETGSEVSDTAELLLFAADRAQHVETVIRPALAAGKVVVSDRYLDSTLAYQGYGRGLDLKRIRAIQEVATGGLGPDFTVWVDVDLETMRIRLAGEAADRLEAGGDAFFERVRGGFQALYEAEPQRIVRVDGRRPIEELADEVYQEMSRRLKKRD